MNFYTIYGKISSALDIIGRLFHSLLNTPRKTDNKQSVSIESVYDLLSD